MKRKPKPKTYTAKTYTVEIWRKGGKVPLLHCGLNYTDADMLFNSAAHGWSERKIIENGSGKIIKYSCKAQLRYGIPPEGAVVIV